MKPLVVDASFAGAWILPDEHSAEADRVLEAALDRDLELALPDLWIYEMENLLLAAHRRNRITKAQVFEAHQLLEALPCRFYSHQGALACDRTAALALRFDLSGYDAAYLELADRLQCQLMTLDNRLLEAARSLGLARRSL
ncbi:MAG: type II toxin-antitoxin system VapC family toxin [Acidobacteriota bacterium]